MTKNEFDIEEIKVLPEPMQDQGYRIWYWMLEGSAFNSPLDPLTQGYWKKSCQAALVYGVAFPPADEKQEHGDLVILVTQNREFVKESHADEPLPVIYRGLLFKHILDLRFPHTEKFNELPLMVQADIRRRLETTFTAYILPKISKDGARYRGFNEMEEYEIQQFDDEERIQCPKCGKLIEEGNDLMVMNGYRIDENTVFINAFCVICGQPFGVRVQGPKE